MTDPSDIRAGLALGVGGLLCLAAWVWQDADHRKLRLPSLRALSVLATAGIATIPYLASTRGSARKAFWIGAFVWMGWMVLVGAGGTTVALLAARNREASTQVARVEAGRRPEVPAPAMGDFDLAFPQTPSQPAPSPQGSR